MESNILYFFSMKNGLSINDVAAFGFLAPEYLLLFSCFGRKNVIGIYISFCVLFMYVPKLSQIIK